MVRELKRSAAATPRRRRTIAVIPTHTVPAMPQPAKTIEFYFDFGSPTTYLAHTQLPRIAGDTGASLAYQPILLGGVFKAAGNQSPVMVAAKARWMVHDLQRHAQRYGVPYTHNPHFPINTLPLMRAAIGLQVHQPELFQRYVDTVFRAMWAEPVNLGDAGVLARVLANAGFDAPALLALTTQPEVKAALIAATDAAVARGVFGAPTMFVGDQMHFGQDRLDFVREAAAA
jgi:2-hydroxychromene-2-carboxylate isomerase